jgi:hypothetical protein
MVKKGSKLYSILHFKCPFCHEGAFFVSHPYDMRHLGDLHPRCPVCNERYEKEPGFYWGGMFVSYALSAAFSLIIFGITWLIAPQLSILQFFLIVVGITILASPFLYALSKIIWANIFFHYRGAPKRS